jgi:hypothetical protein
MNHRLGILLCCLLAAACSDSTDPPSEEADAAHDVTDTSGEDVPDQDAPEDAGDAPEDTAPDLPLVLSITAPAEAAEVWGAVLVTATTSSSRPARIVVDGIERGEATPVDGALRFTWFSTAGPNGARTVEVHSGDVSAAVTVDVQNRALAQSLPDTVKLTPEDDAHPPQLEPAFAEMFEPCAPLPGPVTTVGAEDAAYITPDGEELYLFFTPDARVPPQEQLVDRVTGIYRATRERDTWGEPSRVWLNHHHDPSLDGCETVFGNTMWFCSIRAGRVREIDVFVADRAGPGDPFLDWRYAGDRLNLELLVGELHVGQQGDAIYYHSEREGGLGSTDLWVTRRDGDGWSDAENLTALNSEHPDGYPWVSPDGDEIWFTRSQGAPEIWRALRRDDAWQAPQKVVGPFAGEATFDAAGSLYFTHHFWDDETATILDADIYRCLRR